MTSIEVSAIALAEAGPEIHYLSAERDLEPLGTNRGDGMLALGDPSFDESKLFAALRTGEETEVPLNVVEVAGVLARRTVELREELAEDHAENIINSLLAVSGTVTAEKEERAVLVGTHVDFKATGTLVSLEVHRWREF